jgi:hypothetical protein
MDSVLTILKELSSSYGHDVVRTAAIKFASLKPSDLATITATVGSAEKRKPGRPAKEKKDKEKKPRGKSSWNLYVDEVLAEMQAAAPEGEKITHKMAFAEASARRRLDNPEAQAKYEAYKKKQEEKRAAKKASKASATDSEPELESPVEAAAAAAADAELLHEDDSEDESGYTSAQEDTSPSFNDDEVFTYLFKLQELGTHNMAGCWEPLMSQFPAMDQETAKEYRDRFCNTTEYSALAAKYAPKKQKKAAKKASKKDE